MGWLAGIDGMEVEQRMQDNNEAISNGASAVVDRTKLIEFGMLDNVLKIFVNGSRLCKVISHPAQDSSTRCIPSNSNSQAIGALHVMRSRQISDFGSRM